ncbi:acetyltransferase [Gaetbulibacter sp. M235]|uniref:NeuD/PglB/VioB family sugar acetyltransferase n=1 Tax=Gaetbulibacter sp. M235 TaxID=3126510 RepID=UPI00374FA32B
MSVIEKQNIVVIGASGHAKVVIDILERENKYNIIGLIDSYKPKGMSIFQYKILGTENDLPDLIKNFNFNAGIIAIGDNWIRKLVHDKITQLVPDFKYISAIHPSAIIGKNVTIGQGTVIMPGVIVNIDSKIGNFCILNTKASLDHDGDIKKFSSLAPNATVGGNVTIGSFSAICLGANIIQDITIGKHSIIGAGALVNRDVEDYKMVYGIPAKVIRTINEGEKYLYHAEDFVKPKEVFEINSTLEEIYNKKDWDDVLKEIGYYDFYHTYDYHDLSKNDNETPLLLKYVENDIIIAIPLLIRKIENTNYKDATSVYGYAGPISKNLSFSFDNTQFQEKIKEYFEVNNFVSVFSRLNPFISGQCRALINLGTITRQGKVVNINLKLDIDIQRQNFQNRLKTHINKARRNCTIKRAASEEGLQKFMDIYYENMDRVHAKNSYYFKKDYFQKMVSSQDFKSEVLLAIDNESGETIAASQFVMTNNIVQYHLSGTKNDFLHLTPTKLLIDEMRLIASEKGYTYFNLGGGLGGKDDDSLFNFKASFSKDFKDFFLWKFICNQKVYDELVLKKGVDTDSNFFPLYRSLDDINVTL